MQTNTAKNAIAASYFDHILNASDGLTEDQQYFLRNTNFLENLDAFREMDIYFLEMRDDYGKYFANDLTNFVDNDYAQLKDDDSIMHILSDDNLLGIAKMLSEITGVEVSVCVLAIRTALWTNAHSISFTELGYAGLDAEPIEYEDTHQQMSEEFMNEYCAIFNNLFNYCGDYISMEFEELNFEWASDLMSFPLFVDFMAKNDSWKFPF